MLPAGNVAPPASRHLDSIGPSPSGTPRTLEAIVSYVDPWGDVAYSFISVQNASHYGHKNEIDLESFVSNQAKTEDGYVSEAAVALLSETPYPSSVVGGPSAVLQIVVNPVIVVTSNETESYVTDLQLEEAWSIADDYRKEIEEKLGFNFHKIRIIADNRTEHFSYGMADEDVTITYYRILYADLLKEPEKEKAGYDAMVSLLHSRGGFMTIVNGSALEDKKYAMMSINKYYDKSSPKLFINGISMGSEHSVYRILSQVQLETTVVSQGTFVVNSFFDIYFDISNLTPRNLSLTQFTGYDRAIHNMVADNSSAPSISLIMAVAPNNLTLHGIPDEWWVIDDSSYEVSIPSLAEGVTIPPNATCRGTHIKAISMLSRMAALQADGLMGIVEPDQLHPSMGHLLAMQHEPIVEVCMENQSLVTNFDWGLGLFERYIHMEEVSFGDRPMESVSFNSLPLEEVSFNFVSRIMEDAGVNPLSLVDKMEGDLSPGGILSAFFSHFDPYRMLENYPNATGLDSFFELYKASFQQVLDDSIPGEIPLAFSTRQDALAFLHEHWNETLLALVEHQAMATGSRLSRPLVSPLMEQVSFSYQRIRGFLNDMITLRNLPGYLEPLGYDLKKMKAYSVLPTRLSFMVAANLNGSTEELDKAYDKSTPLLLNALSLNQTFIMAPGQDDDCDGGIIDVEKKPLTAAAVPGTMVKREIEIRNIGLSTAYSLAVYDNRPFLAVSSEDGAPIWKRDSLAPGETWTITYNYTPSVPDAGRTDEQDASDSLRRYVDFPAVCVYNNVTGHPTNPTDAVGWNGGVFYVMSKPLIELEVHTVGVGGIFGWLIGSTLGIPNFIIVGATGTAAAVVVILLVRKWRMTY